jgi:hypothetical protein
MKNNMEKINCENSDSDSNISEKNSLNDNKLFLKQDEIKIHLEVEQNQKHSFIKSGQSSKTFSPLCRQVCSIMFYSNIYFLIYDI